MKITNYYKCVDGMLSVMTDDSRFHPCGLPFRVRPDDPLMAEVNDYIAAHPEALVPEPAPPAPSPAEAKAAKIAQLDAELDALDRKAIRPMRAERAGTATADDLARIAELEKSAVAIRAELATLNG